MPTTRTLRSTTPIIDYTEEDDEFSSAKPVFLADLYEPTPTKSKKPSVKKEVSEAVFECDLNLPEVGLELEVKLFLLSQLDMKGGPTKASTYKCRYLSQLCKQHPLILGSTGSLRRKRVKWLVDRWKRDPDFDETRSNLMRLANSSTRQPLLPTKQQTTTNKSDLPTTTPKKELQLKSPPVIITTKPTTTSMFSPNRSKGTMSSVHLSF